MKILLIVLSQGIALCGLSQIDKNQWLIGGNLGFSYSSTSYDKTTNLSLAPGVGYFLLNQFAAGMKLTAASNTTKKSYNRSTVTQLIPEPFLRYYFLSSTHKLNVFIDGSYGYAFNWYKDSYGSFRDHYWQFSFMGGPAVFLNEHTALEITLGYNYASATATDTLRISSIKIGVGLQIHFGK
jgi:hypothetical protein